MAHTAGPWYVGKHGDNDSDVCAEGGPLICSLRGGSADACDLTADADARLIAAAPDLLAALDSIRSSLMELDDDGCGRPGGGWREMDATHVDELISNSLRLAIDVIAKAEGR